MKNNLRILKENMKYYINSNQFKLVLLLVICFNIYGTAYLSINLNYIDGMINIFSNGYYSVCFFGLLLLNSINTFYKYEKNTLYILRFKDRKDYLKKLIIYVLTSNTILFFMNLIVMMIGLNLFNGGKFVVSKYMDYNILNIIYVLFYLIRLFLITQIITFINICLFKIINNKIVVGINFFLYIIILFSPYEPKKVVSSVSKMFFNVSDYLRVHFYSNFSLEILCSTIYIFIPLIIAFVLFHYTKNNIKSVGV